jgi:uncharacterized protein (TIGR00369 family)
VAAPGAGLLERVASEWENVPVCKHLGVRVVAATQGYARLRLPVQDWMVNADDGSLNGGILATLADSAVGAALWTVYDVGSEIAGHTTTELNITYLAPGTTPEVVAEGRALRKGRTLFVGTAEIKDTNGRLLAAARATYMVFRPS